MLEQPKHVWASEVVSVTIFKQSQRGKAYKKHESAIEYLVSGFGSSKSSSRPWSLALPSAPLKSRKCCQIGGVCERSREER
jgi:hypothetical protein